MNVQIMLTGLTSIIQTAALDNTNVKEDVAMAVSMVLWSALLFAPIAAVSQNYTRLRPLDTSCDLISILCLYLDMSILRSITRTTNTTKVLCNANP